MMKLFHNIVAYSLFWVGVILLFLPPFGTAVGIILIIFSLKSKGKADQADQTTDVDRQRQIENWNKSRRLEGQERVRFRNQFNLNPVSEKTLELYKNLKENREHFSGSQMSYRDDYYKLSYSEKLTHALNSFEKGYEYKGMDYLMESRTDVTFENALFGTDQRYQNICYFLNREPIPELIEDCKEWADFLDWSEKKETLLNKQILSQKAQQFSWVFNQIDEITKNESDRKIIATIIGRQFKEKFESNLFLRRFKGQWTVEIDGEKRKKPEML
jgi:hypothetical protein